MWELGSIVVQTGVAPWCAGPVILYAGAALKDLIALFYVLRQDEHIAVKEFIASLPDLFNRDATLTFAAWQEELLRGEHGSPLYAMDESAQTPLKNELSRIVTAVSLESGVRLAAQERWTLTKDVTAAFERAWLARRLPNLPIPSVRDIYAAVQVAAATATLSYSSRRQLVIEMLLSWSETE